MDINSFVFCSMQLFLITFVLSQYSSLAKFFRMEISDKIVGQMLK